MKVGTKVKWDSQGGGHWTTKIGEIVRVLKQGDVPWKIALKEFPEYRKMFESWGLPGGKNTKEAYFVAVVVKNGVRPRLYMPIPNKLIKMEES